METTISVLARLARKTAKKSLEIFNFCHIAQAMDNVPEQKIKQPQRE